MPLDPYRDPGLGLDDRVEELLSRMTAMEKIALLGCTWVTGRQSGKLQRRNRAQSRL